MHVHTRLSENPALTAEALPQRQTEQRHYVNLKIGTSSRQIQSSTKSERCQLSRVSKAHESWR